MPFDRRRNVGLHHLALKVVDRSALSALYARVAACPTSWLSLRRNDQARAPRCTLWCESLAARVSSSRAFLLPPNNGGPVPQVLALSACDSTSAVSSDRYGKLLKPDMI